MKRLFLRSTGQGSSTRYYDTLTQKTVYEAPRLNDGSVLRISTSWATAFILVFGMLQPVAWIVILVIVFSAWLASRMAKRIVEPLNKLNLEKDAYEELSPLMHRIHSQYQEIQYQLMTLKHKQKEFEPITGNMKEALVLLDDFGRIVSINPAEKELFGVKHHCVGMALVTDPFDKYTYLNIEGQDYNYAVIDFLMGSLQSPYELWNVEKTRKVKLSYENVERNNVCPCGSGKKFKKCCMGTTNMMMDHFIFDLPQNNGTNLLVSESFSVN